MLNCNRDLRQSILIHANEYQKMELRANGYTDVAN